MDWLTTNWSWVATTRRPDTSRTVTAATPRPRRTVTASRQVNPSTSGTATDGGWLVTDGLGDGVAGALAPGTVTAGGVVPSSIGPGPLGAEVDTELDPDPLSSRISHPASSPRSR